MHSTILNVIHVLGRGESSPSRFGDKKLSTSKNSGAAEWRADWKCFDQWNACSE